MGNKDKVEKYLESFNDVFADIINVLCFHESHINPDNLKEGRSETIYKAGNSTLRSQQRDVMKVYCNSKITIAALGIENQSWIDRDMPIRVMGYDYGEYRYQMEQGTERYPVMSIVLNFGEKEWKSPLSLKECFNISPKMEPYISDYKIQVFNIAYLSKEVRNKFQSDFKIIADFFSEKRLGTYQPGNEKIRHVEAVLELLRVFTDDRRYDEIYEDILEKEKQGGVITMCTFAEEMTQKGLDEGLNMGLKALVHSLKYYIKDFGELYKAIIANEEFANVTEEEVSRYF